MARLAAYILPDPPVFLDWQNRALNRLQQIYPLDTENPFGFPTPREALDDTVPMTAESGIKLAEAFVRTLDFNDNEFLNATGLPQDWTT